MKYYYIKFMRRVGIYATVDLFEYFLSKESRDQYATAFKANVENDWLKIVGVGECRIALDRIVPIEDEPKEDSETEDDEMLEPGEILIKSKRKKERSNK